jgi:hypothetical protein
MAQRMTVQLVVETPNEASLQQVEDAINNALDEESGMEWGDWNVGRAKVTDVKRIGRR